MYPVSTFSWQPKRNDTEHTATTFFLETKHLRVVNVSPCVEMGGLRTYDASTDQETNRQELFGNRARLLCSYHRACQLQFVWQASTRLFFAVQKVEVLSVVELQSEAKYWAWDPTQWRIHQLSDISSLSLERIDRSFFGEITRIQVMLLFFFFSVIGRWSKTIWTY